MIYRYDELSLQILSVGRFIHQEGVFWVKERPYAALSLRLSGSGTFDIAGKHLITGVGCIVYIPAGMAYKVEYSGGESIVFHLLDCNYGTPEAYLPRDTRGAEIRFSRALADWKATYSVNAAKASVYALLAQLDAETALPKDEDVLHCISYIETHYADPFFSTDELASLCHVSRSTLQRKCKQHLGVAPWEYIIKLRMNRALELLMAGTSVKEVAHAVGFSDEKYFSRAFRAAFGYPPGAVYRHT